MAPSRAGAIPVPEIETSGQLRSYLNEFRAASRAAAVLADLAANEIEAACETIPDPDAGSGWLGRRKSKRKAKQVAKHMRHSKQCFVDAAGSAVRCWGEFKRQYCPDLAPVGGRRKPMRIVD